MRGFLAAGALALMIVAAPCSADAATLSTLVPQGQGKPEKADKARPAKAQGQGQAQKERGSAQAQAAKAQRAGGSAAAKPAQGRDRARDAERGNSQGSANAARGANARVRGDVAPAELRSRLRELPATIRADSRRAGERKVAGAAARGLARGLSLQQIAVQQNGDRLRVSNRRGDVLFEMDDERAERLGAWNVSPVRDRVDGNAPAFCRSGEGHPVWGREWCAQKGFGLGGSGNLIWGRTRVDDLVLRPGTNRQVLDRGGLIDVLGDVVFGRLGLHALSLGYSEPLRGTWQVEPDRPRILRIGAGDVVIAEFVDIDRNDSADVLLVAVPR